MSDYRVVAAAVAFLLLFLWRVRPVLSDDDAEPAVRGLDAAKDDDARAALLAEAGDRYARGLGGARKAAACYARAMRLRPMSTELVGRASQTLSRQPKVLEGLLWRRLGAGSWSGPARPVAVLLLKELVKVYDETSRTRPRARAIEHLLVELGAPSTEDAAVHLTSKAPLTEAVAATSVVEPDAKVPSPEDEEKA